MQFLYRFAPVVVVVEVRGFVVVGSGVAFVEVLGGVVVVVRGFVVVAFGAVVVVVRAFVVVRVVVRADVEAFPEVPAPRAADETFTGGAVDVGTAANA